MSYHIDGNIKAPSKLRRNFRHCICTSTKHKQWVGVALAVSNESQRMVVVVSGERRHGGPAHCTAYHLLSWRHLPHSTNTHMYHWKKLKKLPSIEIKVRPTMLLYATWAKLYNCHWPQPHHATHFAMLAERKTAVNLSTINSASDLKERYERVFETRHY